MDGRHTIRLKGYDYSGNGYYFVTVCVENRMCILGDVGADRCVCPNDIGIMISYWICELSNHFQNVNVDIWQLMPDHVHLILVIRNVMDIGQTHRSAPTVGQIIQWFKTMTTNEYYKNVKILPCNHELMMEKICSWNIFSDRRRHSRQYYSND